MFFRAKRDFFGLLPIGKAVSLAPIFAKTRTFSLLLLRVKRDFFGLLPNGGRRDYPLGFILSADFSLR